MTYDLTASIVIYNNNRAILLKTIESFLNTSLRVKLYLIDNSETDRLKDLVNDPRCDYVFNSKNLGFGKAHNIGLGKSMTEAGYHLVLNPDVYFETGTLEVLFSYMEANSETGQIMPKVLFPDGQLQYSGKLLPSPLDLIGRRLFRNWSFFRKLNDRYELRASGYNKIMNVPQHLGCFMFIRSNALAKSGLFDEKMFMYMEDIDLTRRINRWYRTEFYPSASIYHAYERGSKKSLRLLRYHIRSAFHYFNKWGWIFDTERQTINRQAVEAYTKTLRST